MSVPSVLLPVFVEVALTFALLFWLGILRWQAVGSGATRLEDIALGEPDWPAQATKVANCFSNQFQLPVLFYAITAFTLITHKADLIFVVLAWVFVLSRIIHAAIQTGINAVPIRGSVYAVGTLALAVMWVIFAVEILSAPAIL